MYARRRIHRIRIRQRCSYIPRSLDVLQIDEVRLACKMSDRKTLAVAEEKQAVQSSPALKAVDYLMVMMRMTGCVTRRNDVGTRHRNEWHLNRKERERE
jgi:hypothetical protein